MQKELLCMNFIKWREHDGKERNKVSFHHLNNLQRNKTKSSLCLNHGEKI